MKKKRQYWDVVNGDDLNEERLSITLFSCLELHYLCYANGISARHYDDQESDDDHELVLVEEEEKEEVQEDQESDDDDHDSWKQSVVEEVQEERQWDGLPSTALLNIFCNTELKDRLQSIPLVCKSWKHVTDDPRCWSSMIPDSISPEHAFIKIRYFDFVFYRNRKGEGEVPREVPDGLSRLRTLIKKSGGGAAITSLHLFPFCHWFDCGNNNEIIRLITNCCPNLKHISFHGYFYLSIEVLLQVLNRCRKLELIDFSFFHRGYDDDSLDIQRLLYCLPNLRGFRINGNEHIAVAIATHLPQLKLLSFDLASSVTSEELSTILFSCLELQYLLVPMQDCDEDILKQAYAQIPEFYYAKDFESPCCISDQMSYSDNNSEYWQESMEDVLNSLKCFEDHEDSNETDYFYIDYYDDIVKQKKEKKEYHAIICYNFERKEGMKEYHYILKKRR